LDAVVRSAINGHGGMPARGGMANLTDAEMRNAVVFMMNAGTVPEKSPVVAQVMPPKEYQVVGGMNVYLGVVPASVIREHAQDYPANISAAPPSGSEQRYITIALFDAKSGTRITDAVVTARVAGTAQASAEKSLKSVTIAGLVTYGDYFAMADGSNYKI